MEPLVFTTLLELRDYLNHQTTRNLREIKSVHSENALMFYGGYCDELEEYEKETFEFAQNN